MLQRQKRASKQGCQIFLGACHQKRKNVPNEHTMCKMFIQYLKCTYKKYINIFQSETLKMFPKLGFLVGKQTIWQPCFLAEANPFHS
jgi:hypothetical protein